MFQSLGHALSCLDGNRTNFYHLLSSSDVCSTNLQSKWEGGTCEQDDCPNTQQSHHCDHSSHCDRLNLLHRQLAQNLHFFRQHQMRVHLRFQHRCCEPIHVFEELFVRICKLHRPLLCSIQHLSQLQLLFHPHAELPAHNILRNRVRDVS
ncbi:hypothetical protein BLNAU_14926 [Blattamonas nauphoetae]|uniref:Uncharacterized protein n=1 Tax=Blattamonas nauphoetae TaxID=2049346 RepID=A0ABQ9XGZ7_9EUKA|nr:hypothetical protein BLNAU_14926 [Blattamonas nauphoetae]